MLACRGIGLGGKRGLSTQGPQVRRAQKDARMNSCGCGEGPIENAFLQGSEFCATPLLAWSLLFNTTNNTLSAHGM